MFFTSLKSSIFSRLFAIQLSLIIITYHWIILDIIIDIKNNVSISLNLGIKINYCPIMTSHNKIIIGVVSFVFTKWRLAARRQGR